MRKVMTGSTKVFLSGVALSLLVVLAGFANTHRLESRLHELEVNCARNLKVVCEIETLMDLATAYPLEGIQAELVAMKNTVVTSKAWPFPTAVAIALVSAVPRMWYFFLRRVRELRDALAGKS
jgi:hypothetical protein